MNPSWENTFNTSLLFWGFVERAMLAARDVGYPFFTWNGWVYKTTDEHINLDKDRVCLVSELSK